MSGKVLKLFRLNEHIGKRLICIPVYKMNNNLYLIVVFSNSHVFLSMDSLGDNNKKDLNFIANYFYRYLNHHKTKVNQKQWLFARHSAFTKQNNAVDCGVFMLTTAYSSIHESFPN